MKPKHVAQQASIILKLAGQADEITSDPAELAVVFRTAAEAAYQVSQHNSTMALTAASIRSLL